jgi:hypothetical protein
VKSAHAVRGTLAMLAMLAILAMQSIMSMNVVAASSGQSVWLFVWYTRDRYTHHASCPA